MNNTQLLLNIKKQKISGVRESTKNANPYLDAIIHTQQNGQRVLLT
jgi:hypothetical protein